MSDSKEFWDDKEAKRYPMPVDVGEVFIEHILAQERIFLAHTEVPIGLEGNGYGSAIIAKALEDVKERGSTLVPLYPFLARYIKKNPEWKELVLKGINIA